MKTQKWVHLVDGKVSDDSHGMIFGTDWISKVTSNVAIEAPTGKIVCQYCGGNGQLVSFKAKYCALINFTFKYSLFKTSKS